MRRCRSDHFSKPITRTPQPKCQLRTNGNRQQGMSRKGEDEAKDDLWLICSVVHAALESAIEELMNGSSSPCTYMSCRAVVGAVLFSKSQEIEQGELSAHLAKFWHTKPNLHLRTLSLRQRQTVQAL
eukprot:IDg17618t1